MSSTSTEVLLKFCCLVKYFFLECSFFVMHSGTKLYTKPATAGNFEPLRPGLFLSSFKESTFGALSDRGCEVIFYGTNGTNADLLFTWWRAYGDQLINMKYCLCFCIDCHLIVANASVWEIVMSSFYRVSSMILTLQLQTYPLIFLHLRFRFIDP